MSADGTCHPEACITGTDDDNGFLTCTECGSYGGHQFLIQEGECVYECGDQYEENDQGQCIKTCKDGQVKVGDKCVSCGVADCAVCERPGKCVQCNEGVWCTLTCDGEYPIHDYL